MNCLTVLMLVLAACPGDAGEEDDGGNNSDTGSTGQTTQTTQTTLTTNTTDDEDSGTTQDTSADSSTGVDPDGGSESTGTAGGSTGTAGGSESSGTAGGSESSGTGAEGAPYGTCDACLAGETAVTITGFEGCYCAPACDAQTECPPPPEGDATAACLLSEMMGADPTMCVLLCSNSQPNCPTGMNCHDIGDPNNPDTGLCTHPEA